MTDWEGAMMAHDAAVTHLVAAAQAVSPDRWAVAPAPGKWSPAEVMVHVALTYEHLTREQQGTATIPVLLPRWKAWMLRRFILPRLLAGRPLPPGVRAPREVRPGGELPDPRAAVARLESATAAWASAMAQNHRRGGGQSIHPFFGALPLPTMLRFVALHTTHHRRQLERAAEGLTMHAG